MEKVFATHDVGSKELELDVVVMAVDLGEKFGELLVESNRIFRLQVIGYDRTGKESETIKIALIPDRGVGVVISKDEEDRNVEEEG